ncbi:MAG TPA: YicC/YloC family endoribonuclease [Bauldia sp.]|nr:YicC/YloC family endoribonuclease [Bauldia sp.]
MTGFARADGAGTGYRWTWELRSVNGKGLDIRLRLPAGFETLEAVTREKIGAALTRGNLQATLTLQSEGGAQRIRVNTAVLDEVAAAMEVVQRRISVQPPTLDGILAIRGVLEQVEGLEDEATRTTLATAIAADLDTAVAALVADRAREGAAIAVVLTGRLAEIERLTAAAEASPARTPEAIRARLSEQIASLVEASSALDPDRLHQEAVLLATRADIREELDRLAAHVSAARALLAEGGAVGRRLDFLAQEFNREVNTLCSKSNDRSLTAIGLDLKAVVDQLREQIQNLE